MDTSKASKQTNRWKKETRLYELLGIRTFRKMLFLLESFKHHKDDRKNLNYHLRDSSIYSMESYKGYILYNTCLHVISICFVAVFFLITMLIEEHYLILTVVMCIVLAVNCYCLMLQRYVFLKIQLHLMRRKDGFARRKALVCQGITTKLQEQEYSDLLGEYEEICIITQNIALGAECFIDEYNSEVLTKISAIIQKPNHITRQNASCSIFDKKMSQIIGSFPEKPKIITSIERKVSTLQKLFKMNDSYNVLYDYAFITSSRQGEELYRVLFPNSTREEIECILSAAVLAYEHVLDIKEGTQ